MKTVKSSQKPIEYNISFRYICPNTDCNYDHWIFLREAQTKGFKIVCECNTVFKVKTIDNIKILYSKTKTKNKINQENGSSDIVPIDTMQLCVTILEGYGFEKTEAKKLIYKVYSQIQDKTPLNIIKNALKSLEITHG
jgi:hypothetical protein